MSGNDLIMRRGVVEISTAFFIRDDFVADYAELCKKFAPRHFETDHFRGVVRVYGVSPEFDITDEHSTAPEYEVVFTRVKNQPLQIDLVRR